MHADPPGLNLGAQIYRAFAAARGTGDDQVQIRGCSLSA